MENQRGNHQIGIRPKVRMVKVHTEEGLSIESYVLVNCPQQNGSNYSNQRSH
jgi:hypothetical protein